MSIVINTQNNGRQTYLRSHKKGQDFANVLDKAQGHKASKAPKIPKKGGSWAMISTGMNTGKLISVYYDKTSTDQDPVMCSTEGDKVHLKDIDPRNASALEMQMYCQYLDDTGQGTGGTFGSYSDLKYVKSSAGFNGLLDNFSFRLNDDSYRNDKQDWVYLTKRIMATVQTNDKKMYGYLDRLYKAMKNDALF